MACDAFTRSGSALSGSYHDDWQLWALNIDLTDRIRLLAADRIEASTYADIKTYSIRGDRSASALKRRPQILAAVVDDRPVPRDAG